LSGKQRSVLDKKLLFDDWGQSNQLPLIFDLFACKIHLQKLSVKTMEKFVRLLNKALTIDLFLVFFFFIWFVVAAIAESMHFNLGWSLWQQLWQPLIQPVLGIMMAGAIATGVIPKIIALLPRTTFDRKPDQDA
jgi:hypothetical protein